MNRTTTLALLGLVIVGSVIAVFVGLGGRSAKASATQQTLQDELTEKAITRIVIEYGEPRVQLEKSGAEWTFPGKWPARQAEAQQLVALLGNLHSRFATVRLKNQDVIEECG